jgi:hypothetical protein
VNEPKLKLGILLNSYIIPAWAYRSLERVANLDCALISVIILNDRKDRGKFETDHNHKYYQDIVYRLMSKIDKILFNRGPDAVASKDILEIFPNVPVIRINPVNGGGYISIDPSETAEIMSYQLDILFQMEFNDLTGSILSTAKYGVWTYYHGDPRAERNDPTGFWEVVNRSPETCSILYELKGNPPIGKVIYSSWIQTHPFSPSRNRNRCFWVSSSFLSRQIELLSRLGEEGFNTLLEKKSIGIEEFHKKKYDTTSNFETLRVYIMLFGRIVREILRRAFHLDQWLLLFSINNSSVQSFSGFREIKPPKDRFWADPHIIQFDSKYYIFIEEYIYKNRKGQISVIEMEQNGTYQEPVLILSKNYHLSYPFVFQWNGNYYMVPETSDNRTIELYECVKFPFEWEFKMNLMENIIAVDTTLLFHQGTWWLFTGITENEGSFPEIELFLFYSTELFTNKWLKHPLAPIVSDVKNARPAGRILHMNENLWRPSQNCANMYGYGFNLNEILLLSEFGYLERKVISVRPDWDQTILGTHTYACEGELTVIDAFRSKLKIFSD